MTTASMPKHRYQLGQVCIFTNRGISGVTGNDGERCRIISIIPIGERVNDEPWYGVQFLDRDHNFGACERELKPVQ